VKLSIKLFKPTFAGYSKLTHVLFHACLKKKHPDFLLFLGRGGCLLVTIRRNDNPKVIRGKSNWKGFIGWWKMCVHCHLTCNCIRVHVHRKGFVWQCFNYSKMCQRGEHPSVDALIIRKLVSWKGKDRVVLEIARGGIPTCDCTQ